MICRWCKMSFPKKGGTYCGTCYPPHIKRNQDNLVDATLMGIYYHPRLRGKIDEKTAKDIREMLRMLAEKTNPASAGKGEQV